LDEPNSFRRKLRCAAAFPASFENSPVGNMKEFSNSNDIAVPFKRRWQAGDKHTINTGRIEKTVEAVAPGSLTNNGAEGARARGGNACTERDE
jgi:hypothetical protein